MNPSTDKKDQLQVDAMRYRWLRDESLHHLVAGPIAIAADKFGEPLIKNGKRIYLDGKELDASIDAAMEMANLEEKT